MSKLAKCALDGCDGFVWFAGIMFGLTWLLIGLVIGRLFLDVYYGRRSCAVCEEHEPKNPKVYLCPKCAERLEIEKEVKP